MSKSQYMLNFILLLTLLIAPTASSESPLPFHQEGVLDAIYPSKNRIVIYDATYHLPKSAEIYHFDPSGKPKNLKSRRPVSHSSLAPGNRVGFTAVYHSGSKQLPVIEKIWILSQN